MDGYKKDSVRRTSGWVLQDDLVKYPYAAGKFATDEQRNALCVEFKRMAFEDGVPVRPAKDCTPDYIALTEFELRDMTTGSLAFIHAVPHDLRQRAFEKFAPLSNPQIPQSHVIWPVEPAEVVVLHPARRERQMAAEIPADEFQLQMKG